MQKGVQLNFFRSIKEAFFFKQFKTRSVFLSSSGENRSRFKEKPSLRLTAGLCFFSHSDYLHCSLCCQEILSYKCIYEALAWSRQSSLCPTITSRCLGWNLGASDRRFKVLREPAGSYSSCIFVFVCVCFICVIMCAYIKTS